MMFVKKNWGDTQLLTQKKRINSCCYVALTRKCGCYNYSKQKRNLICSWLLFFFFSFYVSDFHNLIVLSFSKAAEAIMFSVGWQAVQRTTSKIKIYKLVWWGCKSLFWKIKWRYRCGLAASGQFLSFVNSICKPCCLQNRTRSTRMSLNVGNVTSRIR